MQQRYSCPNCGAQVALGVKFCPNCGTSLNWPTQQQTQPPPVYRQGPVFVPNDSGQGKASTIPAEIKGWNWGAFLLTWIWGIGNNVWVSLIALVGSIVPIVAIVMCFVLGAKGNEWAWQSRRWDSIEQFRRTQSTWAKWGVGIVVGLVVVVLLVLAGIFFYDASYDMTPPSLPPSAGVGIEGVGDVSGGRLGEPCTAVLCVLTPHEGIGLVIGL